jgi:hypothetical protein
MNAAIPILGAWLTAGVTAPQAGPAAPQAVAPDPAASELRLNPAQPDFTLLALPTTLRVPRHKTAFRVTHRFLRPLASGDFGDLLNDFFGFDAGAQIGLELRYGLFRGTQVGIHRTSGKTIQFFGQHDALPQTDGRPFGLSALVSIEGIDNFREEYAPAIGLLLSREFQESGALYLEPMWVGNANPLPDDVGGDQDDSTLLVGIGGRWRVRPTVYVVGEVAPRLAGYDAGVMHASFGVEKRAGGHSFQINFSNSFGTTLAQVARGGFTNDDWYIGFNISRKFWRGR